MKRLGFTGCASLVVLLFLSISAAGQPTGSVVGWGETIVGVDLSTGFKAVAGGGSHSLGLKLDGSISAWGYNSYGQCMVPAPNTGYVAVAAGSMHSLGLRHGGTIVAWGYNNNGECEVPAPNSGFTAISARGSYSLALRADGSVVAWGLNDYGQCDVPEPNTGFTAVAAGYYHSLGLKTDGSIVCWGRNNYGQCNVPEPNTGFVAVAASAFCSWGLKSDGTVIGWGYYPRLPSPNAGFVAIASEIGLRTDGSVVTWGSPEGVPEPNAGFIGIARGSNHYLAVRSDGSVAVWGRNYWGQCDVPAPNLGFRAVTAEWAGCLGLKENGSITVVWGSNVEPSPDTGFVSISKGTYHLLGLRSDGSIVAWGDNYHGQCDVPAPNADFVAIAARGDTNLALRSDGTIAAWGDNTHGQCNVPAPNADFIAIATGGLHCLGLKSDGSIVAWGRNNYKQCNAPNPNTGFKAVAAGINHSLGLKHDGSIICWGSNYYNQCVVPEPNSGFVEIAAGSSHSLAIRSDSSIAAWGYNHYGQCNVPSPNKGFFAIEGARELTVALRDQEAPGTPSDLQAEVLTASKVQLTWNAATDNVGVVGYNIYRQGAKIGTSTTTEYLSTGLLSSTTYTYAVSAYDQAELESERSPIVVVTTPPDTEPPSVPQNVQASARSITSILVSWTASTDNVGVTSYRVYRDGSFIGTNTWPNYIDTGLQSGATYSYTVTACDAVGHESAHSAPPAVATTPSVPDFCSVDLGSTDVNNYLSRVPFTDGGTGAINVGGLNCRQPSNTSNQYFYFAIDDTYIYDGSVATAYLEVCYYDDLSGQAFIEPQYDLNAGAYTALPQVALTGTGRWKTAAWTLTDCLFANRQNGGADFRLYVGPNSVKIDSVRISKSPFSGHASVERDLGVNEIYGGLSHPQYTDGNTIVSLKDGVYGKKPTVAGNNYFYFNVSDAVIYDGSCPTVYLKVGYYDSPDGLITPEYDSVSDAYSAAETLNFTGTNAWRERVWTLNDVKFANSQNSSADFRLYVGTAQNVFIDKVMISRVPFPDEEPPTVPANVQAMGLSPSVIRVTWHPSADNFGVAGYKVFRNGVELDDVQVVEYIDTGLASGATYGYSVMAYDTTGNESALSSEAIGTTMTGIGIAAAKQLPDLSSVGFESHVITAVFSDYFYIGNIERNAGIRVTPLDMPSDLTVGDVVDVGGVLRTVAGERRVTEAVVTFSVK